jgi:hypothetical protein
LILYGREFLRKFCKRFHGFNERLIVFPVNGRKSKFIDNYGRNLFEYSIGGYSIMKVFGFRIGMLAQVLLCLFAICPIALAQVTNASLTGAVTDANGAVLPGVLIHVQNTATNAIQTVETNTSGVYLVAPLNPGPYSVSVEKSGFNKVVQTGITLTVGQAATLNFTLNVGDVKEVVTVTADAELINTTNAEIGTTVGQEAVKELPLNGRNPSTLVLLSAGVVNVLNTGGGTQQGETTMPDESGASAGGGRQGSTYYMLDGAPNMDTYMALAAPFPNPDATQEFRVITNNFDAHYGFAPGAVVSIQTKSGTNQFHGGAFEFIRNSMLNAADYWGHQIDPLHRNTVGGYVGGPVLKDKFFFFGNYQYERNSSQANNQHVNFPTADMFNGDFTALLKVKNPVHVNDPENHFVNNKIDLAKYPFSPAAVKFAKATMPIGTDDADNPGWTQYPGSPKLETYKQYTTRLDYTINDKQRLFQRSFIEYYNNAGSANKGNLMALSANKTGKFYNEVLGHTWMINDTTVNTVNVYWTQMDVLQVGQGLDTTGSPICLSKYIAVTEKANHCYTEGFTISGGFSSSWYEPTGERRTTYGLSDALTKTIGSHTLSAGVDLAHQFAQENTDYPAAPIVNFDSTWTGYGLADFLTGNLHYYMQGGGEIASVKGWMLGLYAQDQYRAKPNLTITAGLRWDPNTPPATTGGRGASFRPGQQSTVFPNAPVGEIFPGDQGLDNALMPTSYGYWEPRIGLSYQPKALPHTSFRAGFGLFTGPLPYSSYNHSADIAPFSPTFTIYDNPLAVVNHTPTAAQQVKFDTPWNSFTGGNQFASGNFASLSYKPAKNSAIVTPVGLQATFSKDFKLGITQSWNFSIEQQLTRALALHLAYVGSQSYHQANIIDANAGGAGAGQASGVRPYSNFGTILVDSSIGTSPYHSLQVGFEQRSFHGLSFQSNFTWAKVQDLASSGNISFTSGLPDPFNIKWNKGISDLNVPLASVTNFVYQTPALKGMNPIVKYVFGTWQISSIYSLQSGKPFGINGGNGNNNAGSLQGGDRADVVAGKPAWSHHGGRSTWLNEYFNTEAFTSNAVGTFGNSGRNIFRRPYVNYADSALSKNISYRERYQLQLRFELFNTFNHVSFGTPDNTPTSGTYGKITGGGDIAARVGQASAKFTF